MIRNVVIHISNEQPLQADLFDIPSPADVGLVCTNIRSMDGKKPIFIDHTASTFFFPYLHVRFLEIPPASLERHRAELAEAGMGGAAPVAPAQAQRAAQPQSPAQDPGTSPAVSGPAPSSTLPSTAPDPGHGEILPVPLPGAGGDAGEGELDIEIELDEDFLRRIREV